MSRGGREAAKVAIVGAGAVGTLLVVTLCEAGADVSIVARPRAAMALARDGIVLRGEGGERRAHPRVVGETASLGPQDIVILAVKGHQVAAARVALAPLIDDRTAVVTTMNGLPWWFADGSPDDVRLARAPDARAAGLSQVVGCLVFVNVVRIGDGVAQHLAGNRIVVGEADNASAPACESMLALLRAGGFDAARSANIRRDIWNKLVSTAIMNPATALLRCCVGAVLDDVEARRTCARAMAEIEALGQALGICPLATTADHLALLGTLRDGRTSMLQDVLAGRTTEVDALMRPVLEIGLRVGVDMPITQALFGLARFLQPQSSTGGNASAEPAAALSSLNTGDMQ